MCHNYELTGDRWLLMEGREAPSMGASRWALLFLQPRLNAHVLIVEVEVDVSITSEPD